MLNSISRSNGRTTPIFSVRTRFWVLLALALIVVPLILLPGRAMAGLPTIVSLEESTPQVGERSSAGRIMLDQRVEQVISRSGRVEIQKLSYPAPGEGEKIVVLMLPKLPDGSYDLNAYQVAIKFTIRLRVSPCDRVLVRGEIENHNLTTQAPVGYFHLKYERAHTRSSLMACTKGDTELRNVEVVSELSNTRKFRENIVLYVPKEVSVTGEVYQRIGTISGQEP